MAQAPSAEISRYGLASQCSNFRCADGDKHIQQPKYVGSYAEVSCQNILKTQAYIDTSIAASIPRLHGSMTENNNSTSYAHITQHVFAITQKLTSKNKIFIALVKSCLSYKSVPVARFVPSISQSVSLSPCGTTRPRDTMTFPAGEHDKRVKLDSKFLGLVSVAGRKSKLRAHVFLRHPGVGEEAVGCWVAAGVRPHLEAAVAAAAPHLQRTAESGP